jgi:signal peptidase II
MSNLKINFPIFVLFTSFNFALLYIIEFFDLWYINNYAQELFRFGWLSVVFAILVGAFVAFKIKINLKYPVSFVMILAGIFGNILERLYFGYVTDYINFGIGVANLADLEIYLGALYICMKEFFPYFKDQFNFKTLSK